MRLQEIEERLSSIKAEIELDGADLDALEKEINDLTEERTGILEKAEKRKALLEGVASLENPTVITNFEDLEKESRKNMTDFNKDNVLASAEYRSAFLKRLQNVELNEVEQRALTTATNSVGAVIPTVTANEIVTKVKEYAPILNEVNLFQVPGGVTVAVEGAIADASLHTQGATITASNDTMIPVTLSAYEITKLITISKSVAKMSIQTFEAWLVNALAEGIANKINAFLINGTGSSEPAGIATAQTWGAANSVTVALAGSLTAANVQTLCGLLGGGYDTNGKFIMSKKTLFSDFMPLQDNAKHALVSREGNQYYVYGYPVLIDERVTLHEAYLGDFKKAIVANLAEDITVTGGIDLKTNSFDYLGCAIFDSKVAVGEAVVKLVKATA